MKIPKLPNKLAVWSSVLTSTSLATLENVGAGFTPPASLNLLKLSPEDFNIDFTSACAITGKVLAYNKNSTK